VGCLYPNSAGFVVVDTFTPTVLFQDQNSDHQGAENASAPSPSRLSIPPQPGDETCRERQAGDSILGVPQHLTRPRLCQSALLYNSHTVDQDVVETFTVLMRIYIGGFILHPGGVE